MALFRRGNPKSEDLFMPVGMSGIETAINSQALQEKLDHIAENENGDRNADEILSALYHYAAHHIVQTSHPASAERMALCAVGGYGRGEMAPFSDLDLLFVLADKKGSSFTESVTEYVLYMLWDLGLKVGQSTRTIDQCISLAKEDQTILTALLDLRFIAGDKQLASDLHLKYGKFVSAGRGRNYITAKLDERDVRHEREGNSRFMARPYSSTPHSRAGDRIAFF